MRHDEAGAIPASGVWAGWDGRRLVWRNDAKSTGIHVELCIDGVVFERVAAVSGMDLLERELALSPSGRNEMEFCLRVAGGAAIGPPWRVLHGVAARAGVDQWQGAIPAMQPLPPGALPSPAQWANAPAVAIVVPIYNSPFLVKRCIAAVLRWTQGPVRLILIDDASSDAGVSALLAEVAGNARILVRRNAENLGYTRSTNLGIELAGEDDVVLLNSDTEVGPRWLAQLRLIACADDRIGTVTAVSDNAGAFSVPELEQSCPIPSRWTLPMAQRAVLQNAGGCLPELPSGNGFCMYVKRAMLDRVGVLDAAAFPSGYGEENDLCQRAERAGWRHVIAGNVLVHHERSASFGDARRAALGVQGMAVLRSRYPDYEAKVGATLYSFARRTLDYRVRRIYADRDGTYAMHAPRPRVLLASAGPTLAAAAALAGILDADHECLVLLDQSGHDDSGKLSLFRHCGANLQHEADVQGDVRAWLARYAIELVHIVAGKELDARLRAAADSVDVAVAESSGDADFQALYAGTTAQIVDFAALAGKLATYCAKLYRSHWRARASFADAGDGP